MTDREYLFYDSKMALSPGELQGLYRFTGWGRSRSVSQIEKMLLGTDLCFSIRYKGQLIAFCRVLTDFVFRASLWDIVVHPDHQGKGLGSSLIDYALNHPMMKDVPMVITYTSELEPFLANQGFKPKDGMMMLLRRPIEYS
ncbi:N-acetylglutamate synthase, GNAT family [Dethiosulfovibrio salsuginis]|uniref:N-acetylglutamate synthase, GNAT family n=2 Tax=Dethiosulfovibrio salsuginis TaxID=561720 RepID=A0A1X7IV10_9BACT|nr:N-acetylglutamate synthase, GNAT family [Dethiosulfovibrio salsuginis]